MNLAAYKETEYRYDIQGIRAIGAILIMIYHLWFNKVSGGVDVFFVVSGYLMMGLLLRRAARGKPINPIVFWGNIVRRVAPTAYTILLITFVLGYFFVPPSSFRVFVNDVLFSAVHLENVRLILLQTDYLAQGQPPSPVQQFWALSMQIQFYFILPILFVIFWFFCRLLNKLWPLTLALSLIAFASLAYSIYLTEASPTTAYFHTGTRVWEFLFGSLLAIILPHLKISYKLARVLGSIGLAGIVSIGVLVSSEAEFPGYIALLPVSFALMLITSGKSEKSCAVVKLLGHRFLTFIGGMSFSIYLWHWPMLSFYKFSTDGESPGLMAGLLIMFLSVILAWLTVILLENRLKKIGAGRVLISYALGVLFFTPVFASSYFSREYVIKSQSELIESWRNNSYESVSYNDVKNGERVLDFSYMNYMSISAWDPDSHFKRSCKQNATRKEVISCEFGDLNSDLTIAMVGGSYIYQWLPPLDVLGKEHGFKIVSMIKNSCPLGALADSDESCYFWNENVIDAITDLSPDYVITNSTRSAASGGESVPEGYVEQWKKISDMHIPIVGLRDNPSYPFDVISCMHKEENASECKIEREFAYQSLDPSLKYIEEVEGFKSIDTADMFCEDEYCYPAVNNLLVMRDSNHLSIAYSLALKNLLEEKLKMAIPEINDVR